MFACAAYLLDEAEFLENVHLEAQDVIRRLRHRACLALWCGNNEVEMMWRLWKRHKSLTVACERFFYRQLPDWIAELDPETIRTGPVRYLQGNLWPRPTVMRTAIHTCGRSGMG